MSLMSKICFVASLLLLINAELIAQKNNYPGELINSWYATNVGEPDGGEMRPTSKKEIMIFNEDGSLKIIVGQNFEADAKWEYLKKSNSLKVTLEMGGRAEEVMLEIRSISDSSLLLVSPDKATEYSLEPPDLDAAAERKAPMYIGSDSNIDGDEWKGVHPFTVKHIEAADGSVDSTEAIGGLILLKIKDKRILRLNENGLTTDIEVSQAEEIDGELHYEMLIEDPEFKGKLIFRADNSCYMIIEESQEKVEYFKRY